MQLDLGVSKPVAQFRHLRLLAVIQVLARAVDLHGGDARLLDTAQQRDGQAMIDEQVRRECVVHFVSVSFRRGLVRGSGAPSRYPLSNPMAATSPCALTRFTV